MLPFSQTVFKGIILTAAIIILALHPFKVLGFQPAEFGIVTVKNLNMRPEPGKDNFPLKTLKEGTRVKILAHKGKWLRIVHEGRTGYIRNKEEYILIINGGEKREDNRDRPDAEIERLEKEVEDIGHKIEERKARMLTFTEREAAVISSLKEIDLTLNRAKRRISIIRSELDALEERIKETTKASEELTIRIEVNEEHVSKRLVALYKLNRLGRIHLFAPSESMCELFQRKTALAHILAYDENMRKNLMEDEVKLQRLIDRLNVQKMKRLSLEADLKEQINIIGRERAKRSKLLADVRNKKLLEMAAIESLREAADALNEVIKSLSIEVDRSRQTDRLLPKTFASLKGLLKMPVKGKIVSSFGPYRCAKFNVTNFRSGVNIKADRGEPIRAVHTGQVLYTDWLRGYGNIIIIDHGDNYYTVYAHVEEPLKAEGDTVKAGEVIATVGDTGSIIGPTLYFEVRHHGRPINPIEWVKIAKE